MDIVRSSTKFSLKLRPLLVEKNIVNCSNEIFKKFYRKDVKRYQQYNLNYDYIIDSFPYDTFLNGVKPLLFMSWNVHFWCDTHDKDNFDSIVHLVNSHKPDVLFLQEATLSKMEKFCMKTNLILQTYYKNTSYAKDKKSIWFITAILTRNTVNVDYSFYKSFINNLSGKEKGYAVSRIVFKGNKKRYIVNLVNVHLESSDLSEEIRFRQILEILNDKRLQNLPIIIGGDFNSITREDYDEVHWRWLMKNSYLDLDPTSTSFLTLPNMVSSLLNQKFIDAGKKNEYNSYTCWTGRRVDYIYHSGDIEVQHYSTCFTDASDHFPILGLIRPKK